MLVTAAVLAVLAAVAVGAVAYRSHAGHSWKTTWADDFTGPVGTAPSSTRWQTDTGTGYPGGAAQWGTGEQEAYTSDPANVSLDGRGALKITATRTASGAWNSGRIETRQADFQAPDGGQLKVSARIQVPASGAGYWPAFWMLGAPFRGVYTNWPGIGEIDVMEHSGGIPNTVHGTLHCGVDPGGPCHETDGLTGQYTSAGTLSGGYHTYAVEWDRTNPVEEIRWYIDGHNYFTVRSDQVDPVTWAKATRHGFFILLNLAIGGAFPGPTDATTQPGASMLVDYVRVQQR